MGKDYIPVGGYGQVWRVANKFLLVILVEISGNFSLTFFAEISNPITQGDMRGFPPGSP